MEDSYQYEATLPLKINEKNELECKNVTHFITEIKPISYFFNIDQIP